MFRAARRFAAQRSRARGKGIEATLRSAGAVFRLRAQLSDRYPARDLPTS